MKLFDIARVCHEANRALSEGLGEIRQPPWADAPEWMRESSRKGVEFAIQYPDATPEDQHVQWVAERLADGWKHGDVKDPLAKTHPCLVPYDKLPREQQLKDQLFRAIVKALTHDS